MILHYLSLLGMFGGAALDLSHIDPEQTTQLDLTADAFDIAPDQTTLIL